MVCAHCQGDAYASQATEVDEERNYQRRGRGASGRDGEGISDCLQGEGSEVDRSEGRLKKKQKEKERGGAGRRIGQRPTRFGQAARADTHIGVRSSSREIRLDERDESEQ